MTDWPHRWFGFWKELGEGCEMCPSIHAFRSGAHYDSAATKRIADYLGNGAVVVSTSRRAFPCLICGKAFTGSLSLRTDGVWVWRDDLVHYFVDHDVVIPKEFLAHMLSNGLVPPKIETVDESKLDFPS